MTLDPNFPTLTRHLMSTLMNSPDQDGSELVSLLVTIQSVVKNISAAVRRAGIFNVLGAQKGGGCMNIQVIPISILGVHEILLSFECILTCLFYVPS